MHVVLCETTEKDDSDEQTQSPVYDKVSAWGTDMPFLHSKVRQSILRVITGSFPWLIDHTRPVVCIQNFGLYPESIQKPLQVFQTDGVCVSVKFESFTPAYSIFKVGK